jgi:hypothetical protein
MSSEDPDFPFHEPSARTQNPPALEAPASRRRAMWPWVVVAFAMGLGVGGAAILATRVSGDALVRALASFVDADGAHVVAAPLAAPPVARPQNVGAPPRPAVLTSKPRPVPVLDLAPVSWQPAPSNPRWAQPPQTAIRPAKTSARPR